MIEAVNSVISNVSVLRVSADQISSSRSFAANAQAVESVSRAPLAPYISPYIALDTNYDKAVLQLRDPNTGDVINQFPSEQTLQARQRQEIVALNQSLSGSTAPGTAQRDVPGFSDRRSVPVGITVVQEVSATPLANARGGAGEALAAVAALSTGAQSGQVNTTTIVTA